MVGPIDHRAFDINEWIAGNDTRFACFLHALLGWLDVFLGNDTTNNLVDEFKTRFWFARFHLDHHMTVLAFTAGLAREFAFPL